MNNVTVDEIHFVILENSESRTGNYEELEGLDIGILRGSGGTENFYRRHNMFRVFEVTQEEQMLEMLETRRVSAIVRDPPIDPVFTNWS